VLITNIVQCDRKLGEIRMHFFKHLSLIYGCCMDDVDIGHVVALVASNWKNNFRYIDSDVGDLKLS
jgi:hypothetical protein